LVDLNHVQAEVLERSPGVDAELAVRILDLRSEGVGSASLEDMDLVLDLPLATLHELQDVAVFLPRD
jgi:DNA uptake protein ComE-like DNA-binding protein